MVCEHGSVVIFMFDGREAGMTSEVPVCWR